MATSNCVRMALRVQKANKIAANASFYMGYIPTYDILPNILVARMFGDFTSETS